MRKENSFLMKKLKNISATKNFLVVVYFILIAHEIYQLLFLKELFSIKIMILKILFLGSIVFWLRIYTLDKSINHFTKYIVLIVFVVYQSINDIIFINTFNQYIIAPYLDFLVITIAPLFLSNIFLIFLSLCEVIRYSILICFFQVHYLGELIFTLSISITTSFLILLILKSLVKDLHSESEKRIKETMLLIMEILELKDPYTKGHSRRVADYALILAKSTKKYDERELDKFYLACLLHDIGKIGIPDKVINKTSQLTDNEYNLIKTHPQLGIKLLKGLSLIEGYEGIIYFHHERWDGKGYPNKLEKYEIPLSARIVSIADAFDAMTSTRSYRFALSADEAYKRIIGGSGSQFDPDLIEKFKDVYPTWIKYIMK